MQQLAHSFNSFEIKQIPRGDNTSAGALRKLASTFFDHLTKKVLVEVLGERNIDNKQIDAIAESTDWTKPYLDYLHHGVLLDDPKEAKQIITKDPQFSVKGMQLYKRGYLAPWLRCMSHEETQVLLDTWPLE